MHIIEAIVHVSTTSFTEQPAANINTAAVVKDTNSAIALAPSSVVCIVYLA